MIRERKEALKKAARVLKAVENGQKASTTSDSLNVKVKGDDIVSLRFSQESVSPLSPDEMELSSKRIVQKQSSGYYLRRLLNGMI
jgi:hypothetical protein